MTTSVDRRECLVAQPHRAPILVGWLRRCASRVRIFGLGAAALLVVSGAAAAADWNPAAWKDESTLDFRTTEPGEAEHWSRVWLVVIDGDLYIRLGSRAADRMTKNQTSPIVGVRIVGAQFDNVRAEAVPDKADAVAAAMADKYWSDVLVRSFSHPLTMRLIVDAAK